MNAGVTGNYTVNGATLPTGTQIRANIKGYDDHDGVTDSITIILPEGSFTTTQQFNVDAQNAMLNVSRAITSTTGETLSNGGLIRLPFQYGTGETGKADSIGSLTTKTDAVWGNDASEKYPGDGTIKSVKEYYQKLKSALEDDKYRRVELCQDIDLVNDNNDDDDSAKAIEVFGRSRTLTINRAVDIDLNGHTINGNVVVSTSDAVDQMNIKSTGAQGRIVGNSARKKDGAALTVSAGSVKEFNLDNVRVDTGINNAYALCINDVYSNSFNNMNGSHIGGDILLTDSNGAGFENSAEIEDGAKFVITSKGDVNLKGDLKDLGTIELQQTAKLTFSKGAELKGLTIIAKAAATRIIFASDTSANDVKVVAENKDIRVTVPSTVVDGLTFIKDGGDFVSVDEKNKEVSSGTSTGDAVDISSKPVSGGVQATLEQLDVLTGQLTEKPQTTVSVGAIVSSGGIYVDELSKYIKDRAYIAPETNERVKDISVTYTLESTNLVQKVNVAGRGTVIKAKDKREDADDILRVVISCGGKTVRREIKITRN